MKTELALREFIHSRVSSNLSPRTIEWYEDRLLHSPNLVPTFPMVQNRLSLSWQPAEVAQKLNETLLMLSELSSGSSANDTGFPTQ
jgi:hypothetical protein